MLTQDPLVLCSPFFFVIQQTVTAQARFANPYFPSAARDLQHRMIREQQLKRL